MAKKSKKTRKKKDLFINAVNYINIFGKDEEYKRNCVTVKKGNKIIKRVKVAKRETPYWLHVIEDINTDNDSDSNNSSDKGSLERKKKIQEELDLEDLDKEIKKKEHKHVLNGTKARELSLTTAVKLISQGSFRTSFEKDDSSKTNQSPKRVHNKRSQNDDKVGGLNGKSPPIIIIKDESDSVEIVEENTKHKRKKKVKKNGNGGNIVKHGTHKATRKSQRKNAGKKKFYDYTTLSSKKASKRKPKKSSTKAINKENNPINNTCQNVLENVCTLCKAPITTTNKLIGDGLNKELISNENLPDGNSIDKSRDTNENVNIINETNVALPVIEKEQLKQPIVLLVLESTISKPNTSVTNIAQVENVSKNDNTQKLDTVVKILKPKTKIINSYISERSKSLDENRTENSLTFERVNVASNTAQSLEERSKSFDENSVSQRIVNSVTSETVDVDCSAVQSLEERSLKSKDENNIFQRTGTSENFNIGSHSLISLEERSNSFVENSASERMINLQFSNSVNVDRNKVQFLDVRSKSFDENNISQRTENTLPSESIKESTNNVTSLGERTKSFDENNVYQKSKNLTSESTFVSSNNIQSLELRSRYLDENSIRTSLISRNNQQGSNELVSLVEERSKCCEESVVSHRTGNSLTSTSVHLNSNSGPRLEPQSNESEQIPTSTSEATNCYREIVEISEKDDSMDSRKDTQQGSNRNKQCVGENLVLPSCSYADGRNGSESNNNYNGIKPSQRLREVRTGGKTIRNLEDQCSENSSSTNTGSRLFDCAILSSTLIRSRALNACDNNTEDANKVSDNLVSTSNNRKKSTDRTKPLSRCSKQNKRGKKICHDKSVSTADNGNVVFGHNSINIMEHNESQPFNSTINEPFQSLQNEVIALSERNKMEIMAKWMNMNKRSLERTRTVSNQQNNTEPSNRRRYQSKEKRNNTTRATEPPARASNTNQYISMPNIPYTSTHQPLQANIREVSPQGNQVTKTRFNPSYVQTNTNNYDQNMTMMNNQYNMYSQQNIPNTSNNYFNNVSTQMSIPNQTHSIHNTQNQLSYHSNYNNQSYDINNHQNQINYNVSNQSNNLPNQYNLQNPMSHQPGHVNNNTINTLQKEMSRHLNQGQSRYQPNIMANQINPPNIMANQINQQNMISNQINQSNMISNQINQTNIMANQINQPNIMANQSNSYQQHELRNDLNINELRNESSQNNVNHQRAVQNIGGKNYANFYHDSSLANHQQAVTNVHVTNNVTLSNPNTEPQVSYPSQQTQLMMQNVNMNQMNPMSNLQNANWMPNQPQNNNNNNMNQIQIQNRYDFSMYNRR